MKKILTVFAAVLLICSCVFAADISVGGAYYGKGKAYAGAYLSGAAEPWKLENANIGFKADLFLGTGRNETGSGNNGKFYALGSVKLVSRWDIKRVSILAGAGVSFDGLIENENEKVEDGQGPVGGFDTELAVSFNATKHLAVGLSFDATFFTAHFSIAKPGVLMPVEDAEFIPSGRFFFSYIF